MVAQSATIISPVFHAAPNGDTCWFCSGNMRTCIIDPLAGAGSLGFRVIKENGRCPGFPEQRQFLMRSAYSVGVTPGEA